MHLRKPLLAISLLLVQASLVWSQTFLETQRQAPAQTFPEFQQQLDSYCRQNAGQAKGWKWIKRWEDFESKRMSPDGSLYDLGEYARAAQAVADEKAAIAKTATGTSWYPLGPNNYAQSPDPNWQTGIGRINCIAFHPTNPNIYWAGVAQGGVWKTVDDGQTWIPLTDNLPMLRVSDICVNPVNTDEIYISVGDFAYFGAGLSLDNRKRHTHYGLGVYKTIDGGLNWTPTGLSVAQTDFDYSLTRRVFIHPSNSMELVAAGTHGIWKSYDAGATFTQVHDSITWDLERDPVTPNILYASTGFRSSLNAGSVSIMKSTDFGTTWTVLPTGIAPRGVVQRVELAISPSDHNYIYALCAGMDASFAGLYRSTDAGATWTMQSSSPNILEWYDGFGGGGQGWYDLALIVHPTDRNTIYTGGINMWGSTDGGVTFDVCSIWYGGYGPTLHADLHQFAYNPASSEYYVCGDGGLYSTPQVVIGSWNDAFNLPGYQLPTVWDKKSGGMQVTSFYRCSTTPAASGNLIGGAQDNGTYFYDGTSWWNIIGGDGMECILHPTDPLTLYGSAQYGYLAASNDAGQSWYSIGGVPETGEWTTPFLLDPNNPDIMYAGYGNVWKSLDAGSTFSAISSFPVNGGLGQPNICSALAISKSNTNYLYAAKRFYYSYGEPSAMWVTTNGGTSWTDRSAGLPDSLYLTSIAVDADDPLTAWVTVGGFTPGVKLFKTTDAGATWTNMSAGLPNLQCNTVIQDHLHPHNPLYVGLDVGVYYINDTITSWQLYATDLPNVIVSDLELDAPNGQIVAATFGRGLWGVSLKDDVISHTTPGSPSYLTMHVFPNPNAGNFELQLEGNAAAGMKLELIDVLGRVVMTQEIAPFKAVWQQEVHTDLPSGTYYARLTGNGGRWVQRVAVQ